MRAAATNSCGSVWQRANRWLAWSLHVLTWSSIVAALALLVALAILGVAEAGYSGAVLLGTAVATVTAGWLMWLFPHVRRWVGNFRPRYGLRTLLLASAVFGVALAWLGSFLREARDQFHRQRMMRASKWSYDFPDSTPRWIYRRFGTDGAVAYGGLENLYKEQVDTESFAALDGLRFRRLCLNFSNVTDDALQRLQPNPAIRKFEAQFTALGDEALAHLAQFGGLEEIDVRKTKVTDAGVAHIVRLPRLRVLILTDTAVTDAAVPHLKAMPQLRYLFLNGTAVTPQAAAGLQQALPDCNVDTTSSSGAAYAPDDY